MARHVCRQWYHMIHTRNFIHSRLQHVAYGLLFDYFSYNDDIIFIAVTQGRIEVSNFSYKFKRAVWASCNGLVLEYEITDPSSFYTANPATEQIFVLPPFSRALAGGATCGIGYVASSMEYKVVVTHYNDYLSKGPQLAILTVGVDKSWRDVCTEHLSLTAKAAYSRPSLITEGFMHWFMGGGTLVVTLNVETEIFAETGAPIPQVYGPQNKTYYMSTGRNLSLLITCGKYLWEVWEMKPETGDWRKLANIDLEAQKCTIERLGYSHGDILMPVGWLKYPDLLMLNISGPGRTFMIFYNLLTQEIGMIDLPPFSEFWKPVVHRNTTLALMAG